MSFQNPLGRAVSITPSNTNLKLLDLIRALSGLSGYPATVHRLQIQADPNAAGVIWRLGNSIMTNTDFGRQISEGESVEFGGGGFNSVRLDELFIRCNIDNQTVHLFIEVS